MTLQQRCWNHELREAVCRCPECGRSFCRECVTEHEARLLCAACLGKLARTSRQPSAARRVLPAVMALAGLVLASLVFFGAGQAMILFSDRLEQTQWQR
jgi:hypothetical protein